jgi:ParB-like chromosome segregation protein Spo0J
MIEWHLETRKISELTPHQSNPRRITKEQYAALKASLDKFGLIDKPIITIDNQIIAGHQRIRILKDEGHKQVECWVPNKELDQHEVDELLIRHNKNTGEWDWDEVANSFEVGDLFEWGFTADDLHLSSDDEDEPKKKKDKLCPHCGESIK